jgi:Prealbumin-like fold domain
VVVPETPGPGPVSVPLTSQDQNIVCTITNVSTKFGDLTVIKHLIPASDSGRFNLLVSGTTTGEKPNAGDVDRLSLTHIPFGPYNVTESAVAPTNLANYDITTTCTNEDNGGGTVAQNPSGPSVSFELSRTNNNVVCIIENRRATVPVAHLTVVKNLVPSSDVGVFDLVIGGDVWARAVGDGGSTGRLEFALGKHTVTEHGANGTDLADFSISTTCVDKAHGGHTVAHNAHGPSVSVNLRRESDDIVCTITNTRTEPPAAAAKSPTPRGRSSGSTRRCPQTLE